MRWLEGDYGGCDSLDVAAVWPSSACLAGIPVPDVSAGPERGERLRTKKGKETP